MVSRTVVVGSRQSAGLAVADRKYTIRINNLSLSTDVDMVSEYITNGIGIDKAKLFSVNELSPPPTISNPTYKCYLIQVAYDLKDTMLDGDNWPSNCFVMPSRNPRPRIGN